MYLTKLFAASMFISVISTGLYADKLKLWQTRTQCEQARDDRALQELICKNIKAQHQGTEPDDWKLSLTGRANKKIVPPGIQTFLPSSISHTRYIDANNPFIILASQSGMHFERYDINRPIKLIVASSHSSQDLISDIANLQELIQWLESRGFLIYKNYLELFGEVPNLSWIDYCDDYFAHVICPYAEPEPDPIIRLVLYRDSTGIRAREGVRLGEALRPWGILSKCACCLGGRVH